MQHGDTPGKRRTNRQITIDARSVQTQRQITKPAWRTQLRYKCSLLPIPSTGLLLAKN